MPKRQKSDPIAFIAEYEDGSIEFFNVDSFTLRNGDVIAGAIAREMQAGKQLKPGKIVRIRRAPG